MEYVSIWFSVSEQTNKKLYECKKLTECSIQCIVQNNSRKNVSSQLILHIRPTVHGIFNQQVTGKTCIAGRLRWNVLLRILKASSICIFKTIVVPKKKSEVSFFNFLVDDDFLCWMESSVSHNQSIYKYWWRPSLDTFNAGIPTSVLVLLLLLHSYTLWDNNTSNNIDIEERELNIDISQQWRI